MWYLKRDLPFQLILFHEWEKFKHHKNSENVKFEGTSNVVSILTIDYVERSRLYFCLPLEEPGNIDLVYIADPLKAKSGFRLVPHSRVIRKISCPNSLD